MALGHAAQAVFRERPYRSVTLQHIGERVELPKNGRGRPTEMPGRSDGWVRMQTGGKAGAALLAGWTAWTEFQARHAEIPAPASVDTTWGARLLVSAAFTVPLGFAAVERTLIDAVLAAVHELNDDGPVAPIKVPPLRSDPEVGPVLRAAVRHGICALFAPWLAPILGRAARPILALSPDQLRGDAEWMSHFLIQTQLRTDVVAKDAVNVQAATLWRFWYDQCVCGRAGSTAERRERAEYDVYAGGVPVEPLARLAGSLLGCQDLPPAADSYARFADRLRDQGRWAEACDALSRAGLAWLMFGDWPAAERLFGESERLAVAEIGPADARVARAWSNRADTAARSGRPDLALRLVRQAIRRRRDEPGAAGRRRLRRSERVCALALGEYGYVTHAVRLAQRLYDDPVLPDDEDLYLLTHALRLSGRCGEALTLLRQVDPACPRRNLAGLADEVRCHLALAEPEDAEAALRPVVEDWIWYAEKRSARDTMRLLILSAQIPRFDQRDDDALRELLHIQKLLAGGTWFAPTDPIFDEVGWALAQTLRGMKDVQGAHAELARVAARQRERVTAGTLFPHHPAIAATHLELAECHEADYQAEPASRHYSWIRRNRALDRAHPLRIAADLGLARLAWAAGDHHALASIIGDLPVAWPLDEEAELTAEASRLRLKLHGRPAR
ncbi:hypothetical protein GCM10029978_036900 [Actinoallomurus acanthiterrae]